MNNKASYPELFFLFFTGSILGFILEGIWRVIRTGTWEKPAGSLSARVITSAAAPSASAAQSYIPSGAFERLCFDNFS